MEGETESCKEVKLIAAVHEVNSGRSTENDVVKLRSGHYLDFSGKRLLQKDVGAVIASCLRPPGPNAASLAPSQLTIFYGGSVCLFDGIPMEKVCEIILVASTTVVVIAAAPVAAANNSGDEKNTIQ